MARREVGFTILSMTLSLSAVFIPILFMGGIIGKLFHEFAVTIGVSILVSGFVSLTLTPMLCSRFLRSDHDTHHGRLYNATERGFDVVLHGYERSLAWVMQHRRETLVFSAVILVATAVLFYSIPKGLFPSDDTGQLLGTTEAAEGVSYDGLIAHQQEVADIIRQDPDVRAVTSSVGTLAAANQGQLTIDLTPIEPAQAGPRIRSLAICPRRSRGSPASRSIIQNPPAIQSAVSSPRACTSTRCRAGTSPLSTRRAPSSKPSCGNCPMLTGVTSDLLIENPQVTIDIDRAARRRTRASPRPRSRTRSTMRSGSGRCRRSTRRPTSTGSCMEVLPQYQQDIASLGSLWCAPGRWARGAASPLPATSGRAWRRAPARRWCR